jgi:hypothetical protein
VNAARIQEQISTDATRAKKCAIETSGTRLYAYRALTLIRISWLRASVIAGIKVKIGIGEAGGAIGGSVIACLTLRAAAFASGYVGESSCWT